MLPRPVWRIAPGPRAVLAWHKSAVLDDGATGLSFVAGIQIAVGVVMTTLQASAQKQLRQLVEQIERLEEEKKALSGDIRDKYAEAKAVGFDVKVLRHVVRLRKKSSAERQEETSVLEVYLHALGMLDAMPHNDADAAAERMVAAE